MTMQTRRTMERTVCECAGATMRTQRVSYTATHDETQQEIVCTLVGAAKRTTCRSPTSNDLPLAAAFPRRRVARGTPPLRRYGARAMANAAAAATVALVAAMSTLLLARGVSAAFADVPDWPGPGGGGGGGPLPPDPQPPGSLFKVALTQKGYIQYLRYSVDVPDLYDFTYCLWLRSDNFTYSQPIFSYSRHETQRLVRGWLRATRRGVLVQLAVRERPVMRVVAGLREGRWHHVCQGWSAARARWALHLDGELVASGLFGHLRGRPVPGGGDVAVGQEVTDSDLGLDDGIEGEVFGFNLVVGGGAGAGRRLARLGYARCVDGRGSPSPGPGARLLVSWAGTPVGLYGGALVQTAQPVCGRF